MVSPPHVVRLPCSLSPVYVSDSSVSAVFRSVSCRLCCRRSWTDQNWRPTVARCAHMFPVELVSTEAPVAFHSLLELQGSWTPSLWSIYTNRSCKPSRQRCTSRCSGHRRNRSGLLLSFANYTADLNVNR